LQALSEILGDTRNSDADYLNTCRSQRNTVEDGHVDGAAEDDAVELIEYSQELKDDVVAFLVYKILNLIKQSGAHKESKK
jgi:hypothetical protein